MTFKPEGLPEQGTITPKEAPESSFDFEREKLEKTYEELEQQNFAKRLGISTTATTEEIKKAFRDKAKVFQADGKPESLFNVYSKITQLLIEAKEKLIERIENHEAEKLERPIRKFREAFEMYRLNERPQNVPAWETYSFLKKLHKEKATPEQMQAAVRNTVIFEIQSKLKRDKSSAEKEASLWVKEGVLTAKEVEEMFSSRAAA